MTNRTDTFTRADSASALGTPSDAGSDWVVLSGTWGISGNKAYKAASDSTQETAYLEASVADVEVQVTIVDKGFSASGSGGPSVPIRIADDNNYILGAILVDNVSFQMYKRVAGSYTQLGSTYTGTLANGDVLKMRCDSANLITFSQNGTSRVSATDAAGSTNTKHGLRSFHGGLSSGVLDGATFDDFSITAIAAAGVVGSYYYRHVAALGGGMSGASS